jgi:hypothetical protein
MVGACISARIGGLSVGHAEANARAVAFLARSVQRQAYVLAFIDGLSPFRRGHCRNSKLIRAIREKPAHCRLNRLWLPWTGVHPMSFDSALQGRMVKAWLADVTECDSSGLSLLTKDGGKRFHWPAIAGMWKRHIGGGTSTMQSSAFRTQRQRFR